MESKESLLKYLEVDASLWKPRSGSMYRNPEDSGAFMDASTTHSHGSFPYIHGNFNIFPRLTFMKASLHFDAKQPNKKVVEASGKTTVKVSGSTLMSMAVSW